MSIDYNSYSDNDVVKLIDDIRATQYKIKVLKTNEEQQKNIIRQIMETRNLTDYWFGSFHVTNKIVQSLQLNVKEFKEAEYELYKEYTEIVTKKVLKIQ